MSYEQLEHWASRLPNPLPAPECYLLEEARGWILLGDLREARHSLNRIPARYALDPVVLELKWLLFQRGGEHEAALTCARAMAAVQPTHPYAWKLQADSLAKLNRFDECLKVASRALERVPLDGEIALDIVRWHCRLNQIERAREWFKRGLAVAQSPEDLTSRALQDPELRLLWGSEPPP